MSELLTQSRPYAEAIFEIAKEENTLDLWVADLSVVAVSMQEAEVKRLIDSPDISQKLKADTFTKLFEGEISNKVLNFVLVLGQAKRLKLLKSVLDNIKNLVALEKNEKNVVISSSYALDSEQVEKIKEAMQRRTGSKINASTEIDEYLIGGIKISYDDQVIDLSLKNKLEALKSQLRN